MELIGCSEGVQCAAIMTTDDGCAAKLNNHQFLANWYVAALSARVSPRVPCLVTRRTRDTACDTCHNLLVKLASRPPRGNLIMLLGRRTPPIFGTQIFSLPDIFVDSQEKDVLEWYWSVFTSSECLTQCPWVRFWGPKMFASLLQATGTCPGDRSHFYWYWFFTGWPVLISN